MTENIKERIYSLTRRHFWAIILAVSIGLIMVGPQLVFLLEMGDSYRGIYMMKSDAETHYLARMQEAYDGNGIGNPFVYEYKNTVPTTFYTISESLLAFSGRVLGISVSNLNLFYKFFLPAVLFILIYFFIFRLLQNRAWSLASATAVLMGYPFMNMPDVINLLTARFPYDSFSIYARPVNPVLSSILFFSYLHVLFSAIEKKNWKWFAALGVMLGFSFYIYFFSFTFLLTLNSIYLLILLFLRKRELAIKMFVATCAGIIIGVPAILHISTLIHHPYFESTTSIAGLTGTHAFIVSSAWIATAVIFFWYFFRNKKSNQEYFLLGLLLTSFVVVNQQVITGITLQEGHYHWYFNIPIFIIILFWSAKHIFVGFSRKICIACFVVVMLSSFYATLFIQYSSYELSKYDTKKEQSYSRVLNWLKNHTPRESVVFADEKISKFIPIFTSNNVVWASHAEYYLLPTERKMYIPTNILESRDIEKELKKYRTDYVVWDTVRYPEWHIDQYLFLVEIYDDGEFKIYAI